MQVYEIGKIGEQIVDCPDCYAKIGYFPADKKTKRMNGMYYTFIKCPVCGKVIILNKEEDKWTDLLD